MTHASADLRQLLSYQLFTSASATTDEERAKWDERIAWTRKRIADEQEVTDIKTTAPVSGAAQSSAENRTQPASDRAHVSEALTGSNS